MDAARTAFAKLDREVTELMGVRRQLEQAVQDRGLFSAEQLDAMIRTFDQQLEEVRRSTQSFKSAARSRLTACLN